MMPIVQIDPFSQVPILIKLRFDNTELAIGTAFMYRYGMNLYLISNWHNFSGRDSQTEKPIGKHGGIPNTVSCYLIRDGKFISREWLNFPLNDKGKPLWFEHPSAGSKIDVGVLPLNLPNGFKAMPVNEMPLTQMTL